MAPKTTILIFMLFMVITSKQPCETHAFSISLVRIDSIESPFFPKNLTTQERHQKLSQLTMIRALYDTDNIATPNALRPPVFRLFSGLYVTQIRIGSQKYSPYLIIDSGSDDTWVQCEGCKNCFQIKGGSFEYRSSSTFHYLPCDHQLCDPNWCQNGICVFQINYLDKTSISGVVSTDTVSFPTEGGSRPGYQTFQDFPNMVFGCGFDNKNVVFGHNSGPNNVIAGIFGLGAGERSIFKQLGSQTNGLFSYCLPSWKAPLDTPAFLHFGNDARIVGEAQRRAQTMKMVPGIPRYLLYLVDISVNSKRLRLDPALFGGKFAIDSGASYTILVKDAYAEVRTEMVEYFQRLYNWRPSKGGKDWMFDLCYEKFLGKNCTSLPSLTFHFDGASLLLKSENLFLEYSTGFCLAMLPIADPAGPSLLGAFQQANHRFLYDVEQSTLSFVSENCQNG